MKLYTSYFAQIRNFPPNLVGLSTAVFEPKWLSKGKSQNGIIWLGVPPLKPNESCNGLCDGHCAIKHPQDCKFLQTYYQQLCNINIKDFMKSLYKLEQKIRTEEGFNEVNFAFLVYETPSNPCSERVMIQRWLKENNIQCEEWKKEV